MVDDVVDDGVVVVDLAQPSPRQMVPTPWRVVDLQMHGVGANDGGGAAVIMATVLVVDGAADGHDGDGMPGGHPSGDGGSH